MNDMLDLIVILAVTILMGLVSVFLVYLTQYKEEIWEEIYKRFGL